MEEHKENGAPARSACTECARRKQKCNKEWPCSHCQKRKVADRCRFKEDSQPAAEQAGLDNFRKRRLNTALLTGDLDSSGEDDEVVETLQGIDSLGYSASHIFFSLTAHDEALRSTSREFVKDPKTHEPLERALQLIPPRPYTDILVQNFLSNVNFHYYIIYPPTFLNQYQQWWTNRTEGKPLGIQWTCLLLMVCACSTQYTDETLQKKLEVDLGNSIQSITEGYHEAARDLGSTIPIGYSHLYNVQQLLHSSYWFKSEARFVECWHVLSSAIREAQELSIHQESKHEKLSEFDLEMRRRIWCVMDTWDWQISALLGRPMVIDRSDSDVGLPTLALEGMQHSPLTHMKMQSTLIRQLFGRFGLIKNVSSMRDIQEYQGILETWISKFPPPFDVNQPERALDGACPWIVLHRHYIRTMAYSMLLDPIRAILAQSFDASSTEDKLQIRRDGIDYCLELMVSLRGFFKHVYPRDAKFHFVLYCIFDTATLLSTAIIHDYADTLPRKDDVYDAINEALVMLRRLRRVTKSAKTTCGVLEIIFKLLPRNKAGATEDLGQKSAKRRRVQNGDTSQQVSSGEPTPNSSQKSSVSPSGIVSPAPPECKPSTENVTHDSLEYRLAAERAQATQSPMNLSVNPAVPAAAFEANPTAPPAAADVVQGSSLPNPYYTAQAHSHPLPGAIAASFDNASAVVFNGSMMSHVPAAVPFDNQALGAATLNPTGFEFSTFDPNAFSTFSHSAPMNQGNEINQGVILGQQNGVPGETPALGPAFAGIANEELGELATLWHYEALNLEFIQSPNPQ